MKIGTIFLVASLFFMSLSSIIKKDANGDVLGKDNPTQETLAELANCLTEKGWVMYSSFTCSACRAQHKGFGKAFKYVKEIECNPNAPKNQVELCLKKKIKKTPTWILEKNGEEIKRLEGYQLLEDLASSAECEI